MRRLLVALACLALFTTVALATQAEESKTEEIVEVPLTWQKAALTDGEELYVELCAVCHGAEGAGDGPAAKALVKPLSDLRLIQDQNDGSFPWEAVEKAIRGGSDIAAHGTMEMPIWGRAFADARPDWKPARRRGLAEQRIYNLTAYLESIQE